MANKPADPKQSQKTPAEIAALLAPSSEPRPRWLVALWLIALSSIFFLLPLYLIFTAVKGDIAGMQSDLNSLKSAASVAPTPLPEVKKLVDALNAAQSQANRLGVLSPTLTAPRPDWPAVMQAINAYNSNEIGLTSLTYASNRITLVGQARSDDNVLAYKNSLEVSRLFARVDVQSIDGVPPGATLTATVTRTPALTSTPRPSATPPPAVTSAPVATTAPSATPTTISTSTLTPTPTSTPDSRDASEPDESQARPIAVGESQQHNFYPVGDVDQVTFLAKAGRYYRVFTSDLALGVDTMLTVRAGSYVGVNDDIAPGTSSSEIIFQNNGDDTMAWVTITNRGQYGPDKTYRISVVEIIPTPTPQPTRTNTPAARLNAPGISALAGIFGAGNFILPPARNARIVPPAQKNSAAESLPALAPVKFVIVLELKLISK